MLYNFVIIIFMKYLDKKRCVFFKIMTCILAQNAQVLTFAF